MILKKKSISWALLSSFSASGAFAASLSRYFPRVLELMADAALNPNFLNEEFEKEKEKLIEGIKSSEKSVSAAARRVENLNYLRC